jgi:SNF family Na+-dependent transporter
MEPAKFRKLNVDLPVEKITDDRPWQVAGWLVAIAFVILVGYAYLIQWK